MQVEDSPLPRIQEDIARLNKRLHELSIQNYKQVVDARESLARSASVSNNLDTTLEQTTSEALPELRANLSAFQDFGKRLVAEHKRTMATIDLHAQLVDLLQIPQLMDTCARSGSVEEALELCAFARTLKIRHEAIAESLEKPLREFLILNNSFVYCFD